MMSLETVPTLIAMVLAPCVVFVEAFRCLPFGAELGRLQRTAAKSITVIRSSRISDHWKGLIIPRYAGRILRSTCLVGSFLLLCCTIFFFTFLATGYFLKSDLPQSLDTFLRVETQISALLVGSLYAMLRARFPPPGNLSHADYSASSSFLHHIALNYRFIRELAFDLDCALVKTASPKQPTPPPVFVTGLARGGTTILLEALYSTGHFTTLTYRNMPFVTAPYLWPRISAHFYQAEEKRERAHGDRLEVNFDSPEAFEEVFWLTFSKEQYVQENSLAFQARDRELEEKYRTYVNAILATSPTGEPATRYLAKNNNNLLRIALIKETFPEAVILVPFRNPRDHAGSLLRQHQRFCAIHQQTPFARKYMNWLGHYEFGEDIKPFEVKGRPQASMAEQAHTLEFWLDYWTALYSKLLQENSQQVTFFDYDSLCADPGPQLTRLAGRLDLEPAALESFATSILSARNYVQVGTGTPATLSQAEQVHQKLLRAAL